MERRKARKYTESGRGTARGIANSDKSREKEEYLSCAYPAEKAPAPVLPKGFRLLYGEDYPDEENKWSALRLSFHPDWEGPDYTASMAQYHGRKRSSLFRDSFECLIVDK